MTVTFYPGFKKRRNSTKQADGSGGSASFPVRLKENTSMMRPVFMISTVNWNWNYASWDGRFYYVIDIVSQANEYFEVHCELDVLATFKTDIGNYTTLLMSWTRSTRPCQTHTRFRLQLRRPDCLPRQEIPVPSSWA